MKMSQDEINASVCTLSKTKDNRKMEYSEFQDVISDCPNMKNISRELLPTFLYFQIKRCTRLMENGN